MQKKGMELSLNMIIIVVLALVFLGIAVALIYKWMPKENIMPIPSACEVYPPTASNPVCISSSYDLRRGDTAELQVSFYNNEDEDWTDSDLPTIACQNSPDGKTLSLSTSATGNSVPVGDTEDYLILVKVPKDAQRGTYPCTLKIENTQESFSIRIN